MCHKKTRNCRNKSLHSSVAFCGGGGAAMAFDDGDELGGGRGVGDDGGGGDESVHRLVH